MVNEASQAGQVPLDPTVWKTGKKRGRSRTRKLVSRHFGYACVRVVHAVVSRLPLRVGRGLACVVGVVAYAAAARERNIALQSLRRVFGAEKSDREIRRIARGVFRHTAEVIIDWVILRRQPREKLEARYPDVAATIRELEQRICRGGKGVVAITGHCGNWELLAHFFALFAPGLLVALAKPLYFEKYQQFIHRLRTENGLKIFYTDDSLRKLIRALKDAKLLGFLADQDLRSNSGVFVDFFGLPAWTVTVPVELAMKTGADLGVCILLRDGAGFRVVTHGPYPPTETGNRESDVLRETQQWTKLLEDEIRKVPEQWSWIHPRWRTTPDRPRRQWDPRLKKESER